MAQVNMYEAHAKEMLSAPHGWQAYRYEVIGGIEAKLIQVTGAVVPLKKSGKNKGCPDWKRRDRATEETAYFTPQEHETWAQEWERKTGKCSDCSGDGKTLARWDAKEGATYKDCKKCSGSGRTKLPDAAEYVKPGAGIELSEQVGLFA